MMRHKALTVFLLTMALTACGGSSLTIPTTAPTTPPTTPPTTAPTARTAPVATTASTPLPSATATVGANVAAVTPAASAYTLRLSIQDASFVNLDKHVPAAGQGNLLLRTTVANAGTKSQTVKAEYFRLRVDGQDLRFDEGATTAAEGVTKINGFRSALGTPIEGSKAETRIIVFVVPLDAKQSTLLLKKDDKSAEDVADPLPVIMPVAQTVAGNATSAVSVTATQRATSAPAPTATARATSAPTAKPTANPLDAQHYDAFVKFMTENFGGPQGTLYRTTWYDRILGYTVIDATAVAQTDLGTSTQDRATAQTICGAMTTYRTFGPETEWLRNVQLYSAGGVLLKQMKDAKPPCS